MATEMEGIWMVIEHILRHQGTQDERLDRLEKYANELAAWGETADDGFAMAAFSLEAGRHRDATMSQRIANLEQAKGEEG